MTENFRKKNFETTPENRFTKKTFSENIVTPALEKTTENSFSAIDKQTRRKKSDVSAFSTDTFEGVQDTFEASDGLSYTPKRRERIDRSQKPYESTDFAELVESDYDIDKNSPFSAFPLTGKLGIRTEAYGETKNHSGINRKMPEGTYIRLPMDVKYKNSGYDYEHGNWIELEDKKGNTLSYRNLMDFGDFSPGTVIAGNTPIARSGKSGKNETLREEYYSPEGRNITESYWRDNQKPSSNGYFNFVNSASKEPFDSFLHSVNSFQVASANDDKKENESKTWGELTKDFKQQAKEWINRRPIIPEINSDTFSNITHPNGIAFYNYYYSNKEKADVYGYIVNQTSTDAGQPERNVADYKLGMADVSDVGCESIAIHNALVASNDAHNYKDVLFKCESITMGAGYLGCNPYAIGSVLNDFGYEYESTKDIKEINNLINGGNVFIISFWNDEKWINRLNPFGNASGLHTVAFKKNSDNTFTAWNLDSGQIEPEILYSPYSLKYRTYEDDSNFIILYSLKG